MSFSPSLFVFGRNGTHEKKKKVLCMCECVCMCSYLCIHVSMQVGVHMCTELQLLNTFIWLKRKRNVGDCKFKAYAFECFL